MKTSQTAPARDVIPGSLAASVARNTLLMIVAASLAGMASAQHVITTTPGAGGGIFPAGPLTVPAGAKPTFFIIPGAGFSIQDVKVDEVSVGNDSQVLVGPVNAPMAIARPAEGAFMGIISTGLGYTTSSGSIHQRLCVPDNGGVLSFRWNFYSEEWLEWIGSQYQDAFVVSVAIVDPDTGVVGPFAPLFTETIDSLAGGVTEADVSFDRGGVYKTGWRTALINLNTFAGRTVVVKFGCTDVGDSIYDSAILLDDIEFMPGATPPSLDLS